MRRTSISLLLAAALAAPSFADIESLTPAAKPTPRPSPSVGAAFDALMPAYDASRSALSADSLAQLAQPSRDLRRALATLGDGLTAAAAGVPEEKLRDVRALLPPLRKSIEALVGASTLPAARTAFGELSKSLVAWRKLAGKGPGVGYCPMASWEWLQPPDADVENPYLGKAMAGCGSIRPEPSR
jgi:hypothetical protein